MINKEKSELINASSRLSRDFSFENCFDAAVKALKVLEKERKVDNGEQKPKDTK